MTAFSLKVKKESAMLLAQFKKIVSPPSELLNLRDIFKPFYVILTLFGLFPYSIRFVQGKHFVIIPKSIYINALCALTLILSITLFLMFHFENIYNSLGDNSMTVNYMTQVNYIIELLNLEVFCIVYYVYSFLNRNTFVMALNTVAACCGSTSNSSVKALRSLRLKIFVTIVLLCILLINQICVNYTRVDSIWKKLLVMFTFIIPQMIQFTAILFYYILISMVVTLLVIIEENISIVTKNWKTQSFMTVENATAMSLTQLESIYAKAFDLKYDINKAFEVPILLTTMQCFHSIVSESHIIYHGAVVECIMTPHAIVNCSVWILYQFFKIYVLSSTGKMLQTQNLKVGQTLHSMPTDNNDIRLLLEIQHFSNLMNYQGMGLTVCEFFPLDGTLIFKVVSSAAMYLIILVQFDNRHKMN